MNRILITGASGFLGRQILSLLDPRLYEVHTVGRSEQLTTSRSVIHHCGSLLDHDFPERLVRSIQPTHLLHLAWCADAGSFWTSPENLQWLSASTRLFESFARHGGQRAVGIGSCAEYDWSGEANLSELSSAGSPATLYGRAKRAAGEFLQAFAAGTSLSAAWGRLFFLYGPAAHPARIPGCLIDSLLSAQRTPCPAGTQIRDYLYVKDAAAALCKLLESDVTGPVNIASGSDTQVIDLMRMAAAECGAADLLQPGASPSYSTNNPRRIVADVTRMTREVGFRPAFDLKRGLAETVAWWREHRADPADRRAA